jgi:hypothetical protein
MITDLWNNCIALASKAFSKSNKYKKVFNNTPEASDILADIANFCGAYDIDLRKTKDGTIDPIDMARRAGKLEVYQYIFKLLSMDETQKNALATRYYAMQAQQQQEFK